MSVDMTTTKGRMLSVRSGRMVRALLRIYWRLLPNRLKPATPAPWHTCMGDAVVDYYFRWHWIAVQQVSFAADHYDYWAETYGTPWGPNNPVRHGGAQPRSCL